MQDQFSRRIYEPISARNPVFRKRARSWHECYTTRSHKPTVSRSLKLHLDLVKSYDAFFISPSFLIYLDYLDNLNFVLILSKDSHFSKA